MVEPMTLERFEELAAAYGGVIACWPVAYRAAAMQMAGEPVPAAVLADAFALDTALDEWVVPTRASDLADRIAAMAPVREPRPLMRLRLWWSGFGVAAALAGAAAGLATVAVLDPGEHMSGTGTSFGDVSGQEG